MPWKESHYMDERVRFIERILEGERMTDLCREFGVSRKTGYKFYNRFLAEGMRGLADDSRRALYYPNQTPKEIEELIVEFRKRKSKWGSKKIKKILEWRHPGIAIPASRRPGRGWRCWVSRLWRSAFRPTWGTGRRWPWHSRPVGR